VDDVDVGALLAVVLEPPGVLLQALDDQLLVGLLLEAEGQQGNLLVVEEGLDVAVGLVPLVLVDGLEDDSVFGVGDEDLVFELAFFHGLEEGYVADGCPQRTYVQLLFELHRVSSVHFRLVDYNYAEINFNIHSIGLIFRYPTAAATITAKTIDPRLSCE
jgi:hypothetical protein